MTSLETVRISVASANQRTGRSGRLGPGVCYRLWTEGTQGALLPFTPPEIRSADLAPLALDLARWGVADVAQLAWLDPPPSGHLAGARSLLHQLGAFDSGGHLTSLGERMSEFPAHPRLARLLVAGQAEGTPGLGADLAALLGERDLVGGQPAGHASARDLLDRLDLLRRRGFDAAARAARYWREKLGAGAPEPAADAAGVGRLLALAYPDRIGREREPGRGRYLFSGGFGARLSLRSAVRGGEWLVAVEVVGKPGGEGEIHLASRLERDMVEDLFGGTLEWQREVDWDEREGRVVAREVRRLGALLLQERPVTPASTDVIPALLQVIRRKGLGVLAWSSAACQWRARVRLIAAHRSGWPDLSDEMLLGTLESWLAPHLSGVTTLVALGRVALFPALQAHLGWERERKLARLAPERLEVPSGSNIRLDYAAEDGPVLACKLQELFGLAETPRIVGGTVPVLIHLLSPAGRPLAVTRDLRSFWDSVYPEVKKEMKGRYPKHPWPDDPWNAVATRHTKLRMRS